MDGQLTVNMISCFGLHGAKIVDENSSTLPFFGQVGYLAELRVGRSIEFNELYYRKMLEGKPINIIVK
jgi:hypothetical protein